MKRVIFLLAILLSSATVVGQSKYLLPVVLPDPVPGAFASQWQSVLSVHNKTDQIVFADLYRPCAFECLVAIPARATVEGVPTLTPLPGRIGPGDFLLLGPDAAGKVNLSLRVQDISRQGLTFGTEIPVVPLSDAFTTPLQLLGVPTDDRFRQMLRVYDFDSRDPGSVVEVNIYDNNGTRVASRQLQLHPNGIAHPGYAEIGFLASEFPVIRALDKVRVEVRPMVSDLRFWAFVSVTHNETQHMTVISPAVD